MTLTPSPTNTSPSVAVIGGSGIYEIDGLVDVTEQHISTPFGEPSDAVISGTLAGRRVHFLPRHGRGHRLLPSEINHRANIHALRSLGVRWVISLGAVGSLQDAYKPRDIVLPTQFFDRTSRREHHTFFGKGIVAHVSFADPVDPVLHALLLEAARNEAPRVHDGGTYVNMDGPAFSTRAESLLNHQLGFDVIGMTNLPEAKLCREAEIAFAALSLVTDYDAWKTDMEAVQVADLIAHLQANAETARRIISRVIPTLPTDLTSPAHRALEFAVITPRHLWPESTARDLAAILPLATKP